MNHFPYRWHLHDHRQSAQGDDQLAVQQGRT